jgi:hypothetical protein
MLRVPDRRSQWHWPLYITQSNLESDVMQASVNKRIVRHIQRANGTYFIHFTTFLLRSVIYFISPFRGSTWLRPPHCLYFEITLRHSTIGMIPLDEWSAHCRDLYLITHNTHKIQISTTPARFEPAIPASERPQTHALDRETTGIGASFQTKIILRKSWTSIPAEIHEPGLVTL